MKYLKKAFGLPENEKYRISEQTRLIFKNAIDEKEKLYQEWEQKFEKSQICSSLTE